MREEAAASAIRDLETRLGEAEAELATLRAELSHAHQLATLGTLTAGIAHEINNILTPVLAYAQLAQASSHDTALTAKAIDRTVSGVQSASRITEAVLGFARGNEDMESCVLDEVVESTLACLGRDPARDGIDLQTAVDSGLLVAISPLALQQVLLNLLLNAIRAMRRRPGAQLHVAAERCGDRAQLTVADTGPGIPPELLDNLFEPFVSGHGRQPAGGEPMQLGGSGLGLAVCKRLIEHAGGTIEVDSEVGRGATFTILLAIQDDTQPKRRHDRSISRQKATRTRK